MSLFGIGKKKEGAAEAKTEKKAAKVPKAAKKVEKKEVAAKGNSSVLIRPHITEKAGILSGSNVYTFEISPRANKHAVKEAIAAAYKVTPVKVSIATIKPARKHLRGRVGFSSGGKKAYVYLKEGDRIEFI